MNEVSNTFRSVVRVIPAFALSSTVGCVIGHFCFGIPHGELGVVVSVPLVIGFLITRVLVLLVPDPPKEEPTPDGIRFVAAFMVFCGLTVAALMLPSAAVYALLGLASLSRGALVSGASGIGGAAVIYILGAIVVIGSRLPLATVAASLEARGTELFWDALRAPTRLSMRLFGHFGNPMSNC